MATGYKLSFTGRQIDEQLKKIDNLKSAYTYAKEGGYIGTEKDFAKDINPENIKKNATPIKGVDYVDGLNATPVTPLFANDISECTDTTMPYVLPNGYIYAYMFTEKPVNLWLKGDVTASRTAEINMSLLAGEYNITLKATSDDTDSPYCVLNRINPLR